MAIEVVTTYSQLERLVSPMPGAAETSVLEFKAQGYRMGKGIPDKERAAAQREACLDFAQFANARGGHIIFGVDEDGDGDGLKIAKGWAPIADPEALRSWLDQAIHNYCVPKTFSREVHPVAIPGGRAIVASIQPSRGMVYVWERNTGTIECATRTSTGKQRMNPDELEQQLMDGTRAARIAFDEVWARASASHVPEVVVSDGIWGAGKTIPAESIRIGLRDASTFQLNIRLAGSNSVRTVAIPYSLLTHVWLDVQQRVVLMLAARLVYEREGYTLHLVR